MGLDHLRSMLAPAFASLFLLLLPCAVLLTRPTAAGIRIPLLRIHRNSHPGLCCEGRTEFIRITSEGRTWINENEVAPGSLRARIAEIMEHRAERVVYVVTDPNISVQQFAQFVDGLKEAVPDLHVIVVSGAVRRDFEEGPVSLCDFVYPLEELTQ